MAIDRDHLTRQTAGDTELQRELLMLFLTQLHDLGMKLDPTASPPADDLADVLHRVRGAASAVGARDLALALAAAERMPQDDVEWPRVLAGLRGQVTAAHAAVAELIAASERTGLAKAGESR